MKCNLESVVTCHYMYNVSEDGRGYKDGNPLKGNTEREQECKQF